MSEKDTLIVATRALEQIKAHIESCDRRYAEQVMKLSEISNKLTEYGENFAEARGAGKMAKALWTAVAAGAGYLGGHVRF